MSVIRVNYLTDFHHEDNVALLTMDRAGVREFRATLCEAVQNGDSRRTSQVSGRANTARATNTSTTCAPQPRRSSSPATKRAALVSASVIARATRWLRRRPRTPRRSRWCD